LPTERSAYASHTREERTEQVYGRRVDRTAPKENRHLYLARPLAGIFNPEALKSREIILTESIIDALTFYRHGMESVTCTYGTENFPPDLFEAIKSHKIESVKLAFDADEAGEKAAAKAAAKLQAVCIECHQIKFPWGSDANSYTLDQGGEALKQAVRDAAWLDPQSPNAAPAAQDSQSQLPNNKANSTVPLVTNLVAKEEKILPEALKTELTKKGDYYEATFGQRSYRVGRA